MGKVSSKYLYIIKCAYLCNLKSHRQTETGIGDRHTKRSPIHGVTLAAAHTAGLHQSWHSTEALCSLWQFLLTPRMPGSRQQEWGQSLNPGFLMRDAGSGSSMCCPAQVWPHHEAGQTPSLQFTMFQSRTSNTNLTKVYNELSLTLM